MYKLIDESGVQRVSDGAFIPACEENRDWQEYHAWLAAGNAPLQEEAGDAQAS
jgi:hypothetical protein